MYCAFDYIISYLRHGCDPYLISWSQWVAIWLEEEGLIEHNTNEN